MKFCVVPDSSERCTGLMAVSGSSTSGLSAAIASSFQVVMPPEKIPAITAGDRLSVSMSGRLKATTIGDT